MRKLLFFMYMLFAVIVGLSQERVPVLRIDPRHAYGGPISEFIDSVEYVPLETKPESIFGDIGKLVITDSSYIISDSDTKSVLFFNTRGKYITKVKSGKDVIPIFDYDPMTQIVSVGFISRYDYLNEAGLIKKRIRFFRFSNMGKPIDTISVGTSDNRFDRGIDLGDGYVIKTNSCSFKETEKPKDSTVYLADIYKSGSLYKRLIPYNQKHKYGFCYFNGSISSSQEEYTVTDGVTYAATPIEHNVYKITRDTAFKIFEVVFTKDVAVPKDILKIEDTKLLDSIRLIGRPPGIIYSLTNIFFSGHKLFLKGSAAFYLSTVSSSELLAYNFIYDTITHKIVALERLTPDEKSSFLPVFDPRDGLMMKGILHHKDRFYAYVASIDMFAALEKNRAKNPQYSPELQQYFKTQNRNSNPVIVKLKLKE